MARERWERIRHNVAELGRAHVRAGVVGAAAGETHGDGDLTIGELALLHELGNPSTKLPPRSFVGRTMEDVGVQTEFERLQTRLVREVIAGRMSRDRALQLLGAWAAAAIQQTIIEDKVAPPLAPATIAAKGSDKVLIDSGELVGAVGWELVK